MKTITQLKEEVKSLMAASSKIDATCVAENRSPNDSELQVKNDILDQVQALRNELDVREREERMMVVLGKPAETLTKPAPDNKGHGITIKDKEKFGSFGEQISAVISAGRPNGHIDPRLFNAATGLNETTPSEGGFLVQQDFSSTLFEEMIETGMLAPKCRRVTISGNSNGIKLNGVDETSRESTLYGGIQVYPKAEAAAATASKPKFREIELNLKKTMGLCYLTEELMQDSVALESWIRPAFVSAFGFKIDDYIIRGTGAGQPLGILNSGALVSVGKETGQAKETLLAENVINMYSRMFAGSLNSAEWYINQNLIPQLFTMSIAVGTGGVPVYLPPGNTLNNAPGGSLFGRPVNPIEHCSTLGTQGDIIFADFSKGYILAEKGGVRSETSIHVQFLYDEEVIKFVIRLDGQTLRASALVPYKGGSGSTQSHFIVLDSRT